jgi:hypothetical protein
VRDLLLCEIYFMIRSNMWLCISMYVSFICNFRVLRLYESVPMYLIGGTFLMWNISTVFSIVSYVCCEVCVVQISSLVF